MKFITICTTIQLYTAVVCAQSTQKPFIKAISVGTRNTFSVFNSDEAMGKGIGGQIRLQFTNHLNSEWYLDYITSKTKTTGRNDYHIGWSLMFYLKNNYDFTKLLHPYLIAGHCFDKTQLFELNNKSNAASRLSMATQAGLGTHINITPKFDCSISSQYMLHFGREIETSYAEGKPVFAKSGLYKTRWASVVYGKFQL